jgi:UDP-2,4-diacetamido-2,4,6-trideoxy-beta-L-altropyranose hydrolase
MKVVFRVDASLQIGSGHVMRCLALAQAFASNGHTCHFISRLHAGHLAPLITARGFRVFALPELPSMSHGDMLRTAHSQWLGCDWIRDAEETLVHLRKLKADMLFVDHYAIDAYWEAAVSPTCRAITAIDDLADRPHQCQLLIDQNLGRNAADYAALTPQNCKVLTGPDYALLRPEFAELRNARLRDRKTSDIQNLLITMGGVDEPNATWRVLMALNGCPLPATCRINVVMGINAPWLQMVKETTRMLPWQVDVLVGVSNMASLMDSADLCIGAAGGTAWERCCLGLPTLMVILADNQLAGARALQQAGAAKILGTPDSINEGLAQAMNQLFIDGTLPHMAAQAHQLVDGLGCTRIVDAALSLYGSGV